MPYDDRERMAKFYGSAFGWQTQMFGEEMGNYVLATTTETDEKGPKRPGTINGGFFPKKSDWPAQYPSVVIAVNDIKEAVQKVTDAGGRVLGEPQVAAVLKEAPILKYATRRRPHYFLNFFQAIKTMRTLTVIFRIVAVLALAGLWPKGLTRI
jgi:predicted enzyme related to lactoylglutathione lyase